MGRIPCCKKDSVKRGQWTPEEDDQLLAYISQNGTKNWRLIPKNAGLQRCGKSCRLRWTNYLRPDLNQGQFSESEEQIIVKLHSVVGNRWSLIAAQLRGRTDNNVKNHWNTELRKKLSGMGIDPVTHKSFSNLMAEIATTLNPSQGTHLAEAALGCFKDEMLHLLTKKSNDLQLQQTIGLEGATNFTGMNMMPLPSSNFQDCFSEPFQYARSESPWTDRMSCTGNTYTDVDHRQGNLFAKLKGKIGQEPDGDNDVRNSSAAFSSDCIYWELPPEDLMNTMI